ncbi:MAG: GGDEF domain-containing protein [Rhizobiales bacterium]|nr:GGDEF domain-containing protein [Hyphomicrobiales bacterium]
MSSRSTQEHNHEISRAVLCKLDELGISTKPENYTIWYHDLTQSNPDLSRSLRLIEAQDVAFSDDVCSQIYQRFFGAEEQTRLIEETCERMEKSMTRLLTQMGSVSAGTDGYGETLEGFQAKLAEPESVSEMRGLIEEVLSETRRMQDHTRQLEQALEDSTKELAAISDHLVTARQQAMTDSLTGIANRRCFDDSLAKMTAKATEENEPLCLLFGDIDHFKEFNDTHGHRVGDQVLKQVALTLTQCIKGRDVAARYGGEEFAVILPQTDLTGAESVSEQIRQSIAKKKIRLKSSGQTLGAITMSIGASEYVPGESQSALIERADQGLYRAKREGRNRTVVQPPDKKQSAA